MQWYMNMLSSVVCSAPIKMMYILHQIQIPKYPLTQDYHKNWMNLISTSFDDIFFHCRLWSIEFSHYHCTIHIWIAKQTQTISFVHYYYLKIEWIELSWRLPCFLTFTVAQKMEHQIIFDVPGVGSSRKCRILSRDGICGKIKSRL